MTARRIRPATLPVLARRANALRRRLRAGVLLGGALLVIPFGSYAELQQRIVDGTIVESVPQGRFIVGARDDSGFISWQVANFKHAPPSSPAVYFLGGSATRECIVGQASLATAIEGAWGRRPLVRMFASNVQDYARALAIVDNLQPAQGGVVVIAVHHCPFAAPRTDALHELNGIDMLMQSPALVDFVERRLGVVSSNSLHKGLARHLADYRANRGVEPFRGRVVSRRLHRYGSAHVSSDAARRWRVTYWVTGKGRPGGAFDTYFSFNAACLTETVKLARSKGFEVLLMEPPQNRLYVKNAFDRYKAKYRPLCATLVADQGAHYVDINQSAALANRDFSDVYHLVESGRAKWQPQLADVLAGILADHIPPPPEPTPTPGPGAGAAAPPRDAPAAPADLESLEAE